MKKANYDRIGLAEVWYPDPIKAGIVACRRPQPDHQFTSIELSARDDLTSPLFDGFSVTVGELFEY